MLAQGKNQPGNMRLLATNGRTSQGPSLTPATTSIAPAPLKSQHGWHTWSCLPTPVSLAPAPRENTLPKSHHFKHKDPAWRNSTCLKDNWNKPQQQTCRELSWQSQEHQRSCRPYCRPSENLSYVIKRHRLVWSIVARSGHPGCESAASFCYLLELNHPSHTQGWRWEETSPAVELVEKSFTFQVA